jgi:hypothetical protein
MTRGGRRYKISRVIEEYDLGNYGERLAKQWTTSGTEGASLRELANQFNRAVLEAALEAAGETDTDVERAYRELTDDDVSSGTRTETRKRLERAGIDVEAVRSDFVSYQAVRTYLREGLGIESPDRGRIDADEAIRTVEQLKGRLDTVAEDRIRRLDERGDIDVGEVRLIPTVNVICEECGTQYDFVNLVRRGGCDCEGSTE